MERAPTRLATAGYLTLGDRRLALSVRERRLLLKAIRSLQARWNDPEVAAWFTQDRAIDERAMEGLARFLGDKPATDPSVAARVTIVAPKEETSCPTE